MSTVVVRFPEIDFQACCGTVEKKDAFLAQCSAANAQRDVSCVDVVSGSAIVTFAGK